MSNPYLTISQLEAFYDVRKTAQLSNDAGGTDPNTANLQALCDTAASELDSHLGARVTLPLASVPKVLTRWCAVMTAKMLFARRGGAPKGLEDDVRWAEAWLEKWDAGQVTLGVSRALTELDYTEPTAADVI